MTNPETGDKKPVVTIVGHVCIDDNVADGLQKVLAGSPAVHQYRRLTRELHLDVSVLAPYGTDFAEYAGDVRMLTPPHDGATLRYRNILDESERRQECSGHDDAVAAGVSPAALLALARTDVLMLCPLIPNLSTDYVRNILNVVPTKAVSILLAQGYLRAIGENGRVAQRSFNEYAEILPLVDIVVFSDEDIDDPLGTAQRWAREFPATKIVVTHNSRGATYFDGGRQARIPTVTLADVSPLDAVGAGDVFATGLVLSYRRDRNIRLAVACGNAAAGHFLTVRHRQHTSPSHSVPVGPPHEELFAAVGDAARMRCHRTGLARTIHAPFELRRETSLLNPGRGSD